MIEVHPNLWVGGQSAYEQRVRHEQSWRVVQACKEPYHRQALGYRGRAAPKDHPEYLVAEREGRLILNMIDAHDPRYIPDELINAAITYIHASLEAGHRVLVHCNQGMSRSPSLAMLYLHRHTNRLPADSLEAAVTFKSIYPPYDPAAGIRSYVRAQWGKQT